MRVASTILHADVICFDQISRSPNLRKIDNKTTRTTSVDQDHQTTIEAATRPLLELTDMSPAAAMQVISGISATAAEAETSIGDDLLHLVAMAETDMMIITVVDRDRLAMATECEHKARRETLATTCLCHEEHPETFLMYRSSSLILWIETSSAGSRKLSLRVMSGSTSCCSLHGCLRRQL